jgi:hypothetical protein
VAWLKVTILTNGRVALYFVTNGVLFMNWFLFNVCLLYLCMIVSYDCMP